MGTFLTGATGYLGSYVSAALLRQGEALNVLVRARSTRDAERRLWQAWQLHFGFEEFRSLVADRVQVFPGDLTEPDLGLAPDARRRLVDSTDSVIHCAASLNRRSERLCLNVNVRGTMSVVDVARDARRSGGLRRFSQVSTVSVAGERQHETVTEDQAVDWERRDYDAYGRTKKLAEELVRRSLPDVPRTVFRPSIVLGDSRRPETTQFDMVRAFSFLAASPVLPLRPSDRIDIVPVDWVTDAIVRVHLASAPAHDVYHLAAGTGAPTYREITDAIAASLDRRAPAYLPGLEKPVAGAAALAERVGPRGSRKVAALLGVFLPYLTYDTVFDNTRIVEETGRAPAPFPEWGIALLEWVRRHRFRYPYLPWPGDEDETLTASNPTPAGSHAT